MLIIRLINLTFFNRSGVVNNEKRSYFTKIIKSYRFNCANALQSFNYRNFVDG
jgi:hypothetical protein